MRLLALAMLLAACATGPSWAERCVAHEGHIESVPQSQMYVVATMCVVYGKYGCQSSIPIYGSHMVMVPVCLSQTGKELDP